MRFLNCQTNFNADLGLGSVRTGSAGKINATVSERQDSAGKTKGSATNLVVGQEESRTQKLVMTPVDGRGDAPKATAPEVSAISKTNTEFNIGGTQSLAAAVNDKAEVPATNGTPATDPT